MGTMQKHKKNAHKKRKPDSFFGEIAQKISDGATLQDLQQAYSPKILKAYMTHAAHHQPANLSQLFGQAASVHNILIDECLDPALIKVVHKKIGRPNTVEQAFGKSIKDKELVPEAIDAGFKAIVTCDALASGPKDIVGITRQYNKSNNGLHLIIVSPNDPNKAICQIRQNAHAIQHLLDQDPDILDLRS